MTSPSPGSPSSECLDPVLRPEAVASSEKRLQERLEPFGFAGTSEVPVLMDTTAAKVEGGSVAFVRRRRLEKDHRPRRNNRPALKDHRREVGGEDPGRLRKSDLPRLSPAQNVSDNPVVD
jgi:hypothetical protein